MSKAVTVHIPISPKIAIIVDVKLGFYVKVQGNEKYVSLNLKALIDTGANGSCISRRIAEDCNLKKISFVKIRSIQGESILPVYEADIQLDNDTCFKNIAFTETAGSKHFDVIIGMDILSCGDFAFSSDNNGLVFSMRFPSKKVPIDFTAN